MTAKSIHPQQALPGVFKALLEVHGALREAGADARLQHLVWLRASQINGCAYCVDMHLREARADGESEARLDRLVVWRHVGDYSPAERAAFAWTEALTSPRQETDLEPLRAALREHFDDREIAMLTVSVAMINLWNRIQISMH